MTERTSEGRRGAKAGWLLGTVAGVLLLVGCDDGGADRTVSKVGERGTPADEMPADPTVESATTQGRTFSQPNAAAGSGVPAEGFWNLGAGSRTVLATGGAGRSALFLCDALAQPVVLALTVLDGDGKAELVTIPQDGRSTTRSVTVGRPDPGAGNIYYSLTSNGREVGNVHAVNTGILPGNTVPSVRSVTLDGTITDCRWAPDTRILAVTPRRTVLVTGRKGQGQLRYRTFDNGSRLARLETATPEQGTKASLDLTGGREQGDATLFANGRYEYRLDSGAATLTVARDGEVVQTEPLLAWTVGGAAGAEG